jgi:hypothetical protein
VAESLSDSIEEINWPPVLDPSRIAIHRESARKEFQFSSGSPAWLTR